MDVEERRAAEEGLSDEELALFDLLFRENISKADRERLKQTSRSDLAARGAAPGSRRDAASPQRSSKTATQASPSAQALFRHRRANNPAPHVIPTGC
jgi:hypothetical protein